MELHCHKFSAPCRAVALTAAALGVDINKVSVDLMSRDHLKPEFLEINFQHMIPTLVDGDLKLWESRAINAYLVNKYGEDDCLYPKDPEAQAVVDRLLYFDIDTLYRRFMKYIYPVACQGAEENPAQLESIQEALGYLEKFLEGHDFAAGDNITIADHSLVASFSSMAEFGIEYSDFPNVSAWYERCKEQMADYEKENDEGAKMFAEFMKAKFAEKAEA